MPNYKTLIVNLIGGPGSGKSSLRAGVFYDLKFRGIDCEEAPEVAKDMVWSKQFFTLGNQIKVFGEQHDRIFRLLGQVEVVITDSPLILTPIYDTRESDTLRKLAMEEFNSMWNRYFSSDASPTIQMGVIKMKMEQLRLTVALPISFWIIKFRLRQPRDWPKARTIS